MLVVDLDGTLLKSDMLYESFWSAFGNDWRTPFKSIAALMRGKAALKDYLGLVAGMRVETLPYDDHVIAYIRDYRMGGGRVALVTASSQILADKIASHLQIFDEVHGSDSKHNLKGANKSAFLIERFGKGAFTYMGDALADLPVWQASQKIVTVNASSALRRKTNKLGKPVEHLATKKLAIRPYIKALRPHQWLKNILIFVPMLLAHQLDAATITMNLMGFVAFSLVASSVYVINDLLDLKADRAHPRKSARPFASGAVSVAHGGGMACALLLAGVAIAAAYGPAFLVALAAYYVLTTAYSLWLKRAIVVDICVLAGLYTMRIIAGGVLTGIELSFWLLAFSVFFFLSLAAVKRQAELSDMLGRNVQFAEGRGYHADDLPIISIVGLAAGYTSVLVLAQYINSPDVQHLYSSPWALWAICCVLLYWVTRIVLITHRGLMNDDPVVFAMKDRVSHISLLLMFGAGLTGVLL